MADLYELERLDEVAQHLGSDEIEVLIEIAGRLSKGADEYGELDLDTDTRDFRAEAAEEAQDALVYLAAEKIRKRRGRGK